MDCATRLIDKWKGSLPKTGPFNLPAHGREAAQRLDSQGNFGRKPPTVLLKSVAAACLSGLHTMVKFRTLRLVT